MIGLTPTIGFNIQTAPNPANYNLTGWWKGADFAANQILGTASVGTSGSRKLYDNSFGNANLPTTGTSLNGIGVLNCTASFVWMETDAAASSFLSTNTGAIVVLCRTMTQTTNDPVTANNRMLFGMVGDYGGIYTTTAPTIIASNTSAGPAEQNESTSYVVGDWHIVTWLHTGGKIYVRQNRNAWSAGVTSGGSFSLFNNLTTSNSIGNSIGYIAEIMTSQTFGQTECDDMAKYLNVKYDLGL